MQSELVTVVSTRCVRQEPLPEAMGAEGEEEMPGPLNQHTPVVPETPAH